MKIKAPELVPKILFCDPATNTSAHSSLSYDAQTSGAETADSEQSPAGSLVIETDFLSETNNQGIIKLELLKEWAVRNKISEAAMEDLLCTLNTIGVEDLPVSTKSSSQINNGDIYKLLKFIQDEITVVRQNQSILSNGQASIVENQREIAKKLEHIDEENTIKNSKWMAQSKLIMECEMKMSRVEESVRQLTGGLLDEKINVGSMLPLETSKAIAEMEEKMEDEEYRQAMRIYLLQRKGLSEDVELLTRALFIDDLLLKYNWDGRWEKEALMNLKLVNTIVRGLFPTKSSKDFEREVKRAIRKSHHRTRQRKYIYKEN